MSPEERTQLVDELIHALDRRHAVDGSRLLELMRAEQALVESLSVIRREIAAIVRGATPPGSEI